VRLNPHVLAAQVEDFGLEAPWIFLYNEQLVYGVRDRVRDWTPRGDDLVLLAGASVAS